MNKINFNNLNNNKQIKELTKIIKKTKRKITNYRKFLTIRILKINND